MAIGAHDKLDKALVKKYQSMKVDNAIVENSMIDPNKLMNTMNDYANAQMEAYRIHQALRDLCTKATTMSFKYTQMKSVKSKKERIAEAAKKVVAAQMAKKNELAQRLAKDPRPTTA